MKTEYKFLHLSDIHFGQERAGNVVVHEDAREMLIRDAAALRETWGFYDSAVLRNAVRAGSSLSDCGDLHCGLHDDPVAVRVVSRREWTEWDVGS